MADQTFDYLRGALLESGVAPRHVRRLLAELHDHLDDLHCEALATGCDAGAARERAVRRMGDQRLLTREILERIDLRTWEYRYPRVARFYYPIAYVLLLPLAPVFAGVARVSMLARWGAALLLGGTVTAAMLLGMQLSIAFG